MPCIVVVNKVLLSKGTAYFPSKTHGFCLILVLNFDMYVDEKRLEKMGEDQQRSSNVVTSKGLIFFFTTLGKTVRFLCYNSTRLT